MCPTLPNLARVQIQKLVLFSLAESVKGGFESCKVDHIAVSSSPDVIGLETGRADQQPVLAILDTDPKDQRRGAGGMLVQWGTDIADKEGIPAYLESSAEGYSLYNKHGFKDIESWDFDLEPWGKSGSSRIVWMLRPPKQP